MTRILLLTALLWGSTAWAADQATIERLLDGTDDVARSTSSIAVMEMQVKTDRYERTMKMQAWSKGTEKSLVRILEPAKDSGTATLKVDDNLWNYLPKVDRTMKVPAGMMSGSWMGSHFSNDDLVKESRLSEDFTAKVTSEPAADKTGKWVIELTPKADAAVVWGKITATIRSDEIPEKIEYFDEKGVLVKSMTFTDVREMDGKKVPAVMTMLPADKPGEFTKMTYISLDLEAGLDDGLFSLQALKH
jgi:hypothetical protein